MSTGRSALTSIPLPELLSVASDSRNGGAAYLGNVYALTPGLSAWDLLGFATSGGGVATVSDARVPQPPSASFYVAEQDAELERQRLLARVTAERRSLLPRRRGLSRPAPSSAAPPQIQFGGAPVRDAEAAERVLTEVSARRVPFSLAVSASRRSSSVSWTPEREAPGQPPASVSFSSLPVYSCSSLELGFGASPAAAASAPSAALYKPWFLSKQQLTSVLSWVEEYQARTALPTRARRRRERSAGTVRAGLLAHALSRGALVSIGADRPGGGREENEAEDDEEDEDGEGKLQKQYLKEFGSELSGGEGEGGAQPPPGGEAPRRGHQPTIALALPKELLPPAWPEQGRAMAEPLGPLHSGLAALASGLLLGAGVVLELGAPLGDVGDRLLVRTRWGRRALCSDLSLWQALRAGPPRVQQRRLGEVRGGGKGGEGGEEPSRPLFVADLGLGGVMEALLAAAS